MGVKENLLTTLMNDLTPEQRAEHIAREAWALVVLADRVGVTLRISHRPLQPLAMGNTMHVVEAWPARHGPRAQPAP